MILGTLEPRKIIDIFDLVDAAKNNDLYDIGNLGFAVLFKIYKSNISGFPKSNVATRGKFNLFLETNDIHGLHIEGEEYYDLLTLCYSVDDVKKESTIPIPKMTYNALSTAIKVQPKVVAKLNHQRKILPKEKRYSKNHFIFELLEKTTPINVTTKDINYILAKPKYMDIKDRIDNKQISELGIEGILNLLYVYLHEDLDEDKSECAYQGVQ